MDDRFVRQAVCGQLCGNSQIGVGCEAGGVEDRVGCDVQSADAAVGGQRTTVQSYCAGTAEEKDVE